jgi:hypothetical protein
MWRRFVAVAAAVVAVAAGAGLLSGSGSKAKPTAADNSLLLAGERVQECPGASDVGQWSDAKLAAGGAADGLPAFGDTRLELVQAALSANRAELAEHFPAATFAVGPGWGVTYVLGPNHSIGYRHTRDYAVYARFPSLADCDNAHFFVQYGGGRVPIRSVYSAAAEPR